MTILRFAVVLGVLIFIHELGHFLAAKWSGVRVREFALGFGPAVLKKRVGETVYAIRIIPLGGFVSMAGMEPTDPEDPEGGEVDDDEHAFHRRPVWHRLIIMGAGPAMNLAFAILVNALVISMLVVTVGPVVPGSPAERAGIVEGDRLVRLDGERVVTMEQVVRTIQQSEGEPVEVVVERDGAYRTLVVRPEVDPAEGEQGVPKIGIEMMLSVGTARRPLLESLAVGAGQTWNAITGLVVTITQYVTGQQRPELAGPIGIFQMTDTFAQGGMITLLSFVAMLSVSLGVFNLLPIPVLDGGGILLLIIEAVRGRPLSPETRGLAQLVGLSLLILIMLYATFQDLGRIGSDELTLGMETHREVPADHPWQPLKDGVEDWRFS